MTVALSVVGKSDVGKTTLLEKLLPEIKRRGYRVATIKHDVHGFSIDLPGKDSWRHTQAGSDIAVISSADKVALVRKVSQELSLNEIAHLIGSSVDLILTEGFKRGPWPKIEVHRKEMGADLLCTARELICIATDEHVPMEVPQFDINDATGIVDLIEERFLKPQVGLGEVRLTVNGAMVPLKPFVQDMIGNAMTGMVAALRDTDNAREIELVIKIAR
ncbi:MAG: molybdopterin-guanine dinucleotide biosynthesis protein B [Chloroflexota bacterium]|nr:MAG: molybdopterin-guanine dinucleotide biosynthesis protein B [Chloroflexota bacterium]